LPRVPIELSSLPPATMPQPHEWVPPPRFGQVTFDAYQPQHPSQTLAKTAVERFVAGIPGSLQPARKLGAWWRRGKPHPQPAGLYLDGGFGVGKTHLMAAAWHAASAPTKLYLSFAELVAAIGVLGMQRAIGALGGAQLYCIDEFELDDPGNTLIVKSFLAAVFERGARVITTSNTAPEAQGEGRFDARAFQREIQSIAARFDVVRVDGEDYRVRTLPSANTHLSAQAPPTRQEDARVWVDWETLHQGLMALHPVRYGSWTRSAAGWVVHGVTPLHDQQRALRFVHWIDKLYDQRVPLWLSGSATLDTLFDAGFARGAYAKKYDRCRSRVQELLAESAADDATSAHNR
jgi:cell division protein ZapE